MHRYDRPMIDHAIWAPLRPRVFFLHIPKTAGMALRLYLSNQYPASQIMPASDWPSLAQIDAGDLSKYRLYQGHFTRSILDLLPSGVRTIVFLREPVARTISHLRHLSRDPHFHPLHALAAGRSLDALVQDDAIMGPCSNVQTGQLSNDIPGEMFLTHLRLEQTAGRTPNLDAFTVPPDLARAERALAQFHFIGFVESLQDDIVLLSAAFGLHPPAVVPKSNDNPDGALDIDGLRPDTLAILRERNALDIALYKRARRRVHLTRSAVGAALLDWGIYEPISRPTEFPMSGPIPGSNWYDCEESDGIAYRWTGPLNETLLDLPLAPGLRFEVSLTVRLPRIEDLSVRLDGAELPLSCSASEHGGHRIGFWVPAKAVQPGGLTSLCFRTKMPFRGFGSDMRTLSFMVSQLSISRVEPETDAKPTATRAASRSIGRGTSRRKQPAIRSKAGAPPTAGPFATELPLTSPGKVVLVGEPTGIYRDGWVRDRATFSCRAVDAITSLSLQIWAPPGETPLTLALRVLAESDVSFTVQREIVCDLQTAIHATPSMEFSVELLANHEARLSETDERSASYILRSIAFA